MDVGYRTRHDPVERERHAEAILLSETHSQVLFEAWVIPDLRVQCRKIRLRLIVPSQLRERSWGQRALHPPVKQSPLETGESCQWI